MKKIVTPLLLLGAAGALILDGRCASDAVRNAINLCMKTLIPGLFPLFVVSAMAVPHLRSLRVPGLAKLLGLPEGSEGLYILGMLGGFPVGAVCISRMVRSGALSRSDARRMLGLCSNCGPSFLFGVLACTLSIQAAILIFLLQLLSSLMIGMLWPGQPGEIRQQRATPVSLTSAVRQSISSMANVCAWVILAAVLTGFLLRWLLPMIHGPMNALLTGLLELTGGIMALPGLTLSRQLILGTIIICFGGISVMLQIRSVASEADIPMGSCVKQKAIQAILGGILCWAYLRFGLPGILAPMGAVLWRKIAVEISRGLMYNTERKEGI